MDQKNFPIFCQPQGNPVVMGGEVALDGSSYYRCDVPSIQDKALATWQMGIPGSCPAKRPYVHGLGSIESSPVDSTPGNPVFYRDDIQFNIPFNPATQQASLTMTFDQASAESGDFFVTAAGHDFTGYFVRSGGNFSPTFVVDNMTLSSNPAVISQPMVLSNLASTVYLGYSPVTGEYFEGTIGPLEVDPVCTTTG